MILRDLFVLPFVLAIIMCNKISANKLPPNIILIVADDLGLDDVSFRGSNEFLTPNIDSLGYHGMIVGNYYVPALCTPSRAALMTGKNPINTGMQHHVILNTQPWGLPLTEKTMGEVFQEAGYSTNLIGKWHLGFSEIAYTPLYRGFDHHYGYYGGYIDYYTRESESPANSNLSSGYDFRRDLNVECLGNKTYATDLFTNEAIRVINNHNKAEPMLMIINHLAPHTGNSYNPMQAPKEEISKFWYIKDPKRRTYAAMVSKLDESVGRVVEALGKRRMLKNSIIVFYSDNGAPTVGVHSNKGSNYPLKGQKDSPWEGGVRSSCVIWSPMLQNRHTVWNQTFYVADWLPSLAAAAGIELDDEIEYDGLNLWPELMMGEVSRSNRQIVHNINDIKNYVSYLDWPFKYVNGTTSNGIYDDWLSKRNQLSYDPRSIFYPCTIRSSMVSQHLQEFSNNKLSSRTIKKLRAQTQINCSARRVPCNPLGGECLFNIENDPCEHENLANLPRYKRKLLSMKDEIERLRRNAVNPVNKPVDNSSNPRNYHCLWTWWKDSYPSSSTRCYCQKQTNRW